MPKPQQKTTSNVKSLQKPKNLTEIRESLGNLISPVDPNFILKDFEEKNIKYNGDLSKPDFAVIAKKAAGLLGVERHYLVAESVQEERWQPLIIEFSQALVKEYSCTTKNEIALAGLAAAAYYRALYMTRKINMLTNMEAMGSIAMNLVSHISKDVDRAYRQYFQAIQTLQDRRQPPMSVKVQTKAAFISQNQTINSEHKQVYENNDQQ